MNMLIYHASGSFWSMRCLIVYTYHICQSALVATWAPGCVVVGKGALCTRAGLGGTTVLGTLLLAQCHVMIIMTGNTDWLSAQAPE